MLTSRGASLLKRGFSHILWLPHIMFLGCSSFVRQASTVDFKSTLKPDEHICTDWGGEGGGLKKKTTAVELDPKGCLFHGSIVGQAKGNGNSLTYYLLPFPAFAAGHLRKAC